MAVAVAGVVDGWKAASQRWQGACLSSAIRKTVHGTVFLWSAAWHASKFQSTCRAPIKDFAQISL
jgi:hypothetical protein